MQCIIWFSFLNVVGIQSNPEILHGFIKGSWKISGQALWYVIRYSNTCTRYQIILFPSSLTRFTGTLELNCVAVISFDENNNGQYFSVGGQLEWDEFLKWIDRVLLMISWCLLLVLSQDENATGRFLKSQSNLDKTRAGKMMAAVGKSQSFSAQQRYHFTDYYNWSWRALILWWTQTLEPLMVLGIKNVYTL